METCYPRHGEHTAGSSYRTYEEWKPKVDALTEQVQDRSYRTYEEWKPISFGVNILRSPPFLPYL